MGSVEEGARELLGEERLGEIAQRQHEGPHASVVLDLEAEVGVGVHLGEEMGVGALLQEPALALELGCHDLIGLVKLAKLVEAGHPRNHDAAQGH